MKKFSIWLSEAYKNLYKSILITLLTIVFLIVLFMFIAIFSNVLVTSSYEISLINNEAYLLNKQFYLKRLDNTKLYYEIPQNTTAEEKEKMAIELENFFNSLKKMEDENFVSIRVMSYSYILFDLPDELKKDGKSAQIYRVDENFFKYEYLPLSEGKNLNEEDFNFSYIPTNENRYLIIPVLAGSNYSQYYSIGDRITISSELTKSDKINNVDFNNYEKILYTQEWCAVYEIKGFIEEGTTFTNPSGAISLTDNAIFAINKPITMSNFPNSGIETLNLSLFEMMSFKFYISSEKTDEYIIKLNEMLNKTCLSGFYEIKETFGSSSGKILVNILLVRNESFIVIAILLFSFSIIGISIATINKFKGNLKDYGTHILLGATSFDISMMGVIEMSIQLLIADILIHLPFLLAPLDIPLINFINRNIPYFQSTQMYVMLGIANLVFIAVTVLCNLYCIKKYPLIEIIRRKE